MKRKSAPMKVNHFVAIFEFMFPAVMLLRMRPYAASTAVCTRFGRSDMRRAM